MGLRSLLMGWCISLPVFEFLDNRAAKGYSEKADAISKATDAPTGERELVMPATETKPNQPSKLGPL